MHKIQETFEKRFTFLFQLDKVRSETYGNARCICYSIRNKEQMNMQLYTQAIKKYFKTKSNHREVLKYGKLLGNRRYNQDLYGRIVMRIPEQLNASIRNMAEI